MNDNERNDKINARLLEEESDPTVKLWWLSFCDPELPKGRSFLGVIIIEAIGYAHAIKKAWDMKINPGGEVLGFLVGPVQVPKIPREFYDRLLSKEHLAKADLI
jgi:hypothetical protein